MAERFFAGLDGGARTMLLAVPASAVARLLLSLRPRACRCGSCGRRRSDIAEKIRALCEACLMKIRESAVQKSSLSSQSSKANPLDRLVLTEAVSDSDHKSEDNGQMLKIARRFLASIFSEVWKVAEPPTRSEIVEFAHEEEDTRNETGKQLFWRAAKFLFNQRIKEAFRAKTAEQAVFELMEEEQHKTERMKAKKNVKRKQRERNQTALIQAETSPQDSKVSEQPMQLSDAAIDDLASRPLRNFDRDKSLCEQQQPRLQQLQPPLLGNRNETDRLPTANMDSSVVILVEQPGSVSHRDMEPAIDEDTLFMLNNHATPQPRFVFNSATDQLSEIAEAAATVQDQGTAISEPIEDRSAIVVESSPPESENEQSAVSSPIVSSEQMVASVDQNKASIQTNSAFVAQDEDPENIQPAGKSARRRRRPRRGSNVDRAQFDSNNFSPLHMQIVFELENQCQDPSTVFDTLSTAPPIMPVPSAVDESGAGLQTDESQTMPLATVGWDLFDIFSIDQHSSKRPNRCTKERLESIRQRWNVGVDVDSLACASCSRTSVHYLGLAWMRIEPCKCSHCVACASQLDLDGCYDNCPVCQRPLRKSNIVPLCVEQHVAERSVSLEGRCRDVSPTGGAINWNAFFGIA